MTAVGGMSMVDEEVFRWLADSRTTRVADIGVVKWYDWPIGVPGTYG